MPPLNFDDTLGVAEAIAAAGAPKAAATYPRHPRTLSTIFTEARSVQDDRRRYSEQAAVGRAELLRRLAGTKHKDARAEIEQLVVDHDARTRRRMAEFAERSDAANDRMETDGRCVGAVHDFLMETVGQGKRLRDVPLPVPAVLPAGIAATIEARRAELAVNAERRTEIEGRPARPDDLKAAISNAVTAEAEKGRPSFNPRLRGGGDPSKFADELLIKLHSGAFQTVSQGGIPFLVWLLRDQIEARLHALMDEYDLTGAMSDTEQSAALAALNAERLTLEREEEALIRIAEAQGMNIARRPDMDPRAAIMVEVR